MSNYGKCPQCDKHLCNASIPNYCMYCGFNFKSLIKSRENSYDKLLKFFEVQKTMYYNFNINGKCKLIEYSNGYYRLKQNNNSYFFSCNEKNIIKSDNNVLILTDDDISIELKIEDKKIKN